MPNSTGSNAVEEYLYDWEEQVCKSLRHGELVSEDRLRLVAFIQYLRRVDEEERATVLAWTSRLMEQNIRNLGAVSAFEIVIALAIFLYQNTKN